MEVEEETKLLPYIEFENCQCTKAELLQEGIFFTHQFICQRRFSNEKVGNQRKLGPFNVSNLKVEY